MFGALLSVLLIWGLTIYLVYSAVIRCFNPETIDSLIMTITAAIGVFLNVMMAVILHSGMVGDIENDHHGLPDEDEEEEDSSDDEEESIFDMHREKKAFSTKKTRPPKDSMDQTHSKQRLT